MTDVFQRGPGTSNSAGHPTFSPTTTAGRRLHGDFVRKVTANPAGDWYSREYVQASILAIEAEASEANGLTIFGPQQIEGLQREARQQERERLRAKWSAYWEWLVTQPIYGNGGGWGEAAMLRVATLLADPEGTP
jgi:hypothetical protein